MILKAICYDMNCLMAEAKLRSACYFHLLYDFVVAVTDGYLWVVVAVARELIFADL